ncbi:MAG: hypothetical protein EOL87_00340 [Spartobacteria bacterium]|nr:hypothetical protein [Spartobacteria bacterium]
MVRKPITLSYIDIILGADAETIRQAYESRVKIDELLDERRQAYERIHELETQIEEIVGTPGTFMYPAPPMEVAGYPKLEAASFPVPTPPKRPAKPAAPKPEPKPVSDTVKNMPSE